MGTRIHLPAPGRAGFEYGIRRSYRITFMAVKTGSGHTARVSHQGFVRAADCAPVRRRFQPLGVGREASAAFVREKAGRSGPLPTRTFAAFTAEDPVIKRVRPKCVVKHLPWIQSYSH